MRRIVESITQIRPCIFKKCPSLVPALLDIFNCCWTESVVPKDWKVAAIKMIGKAFAPPPHFFVGIVDKTY